MNKLKCILTPLAMSFWFPMLIMLGYFIYRGMAPFGNQTILTVDLGQQYIDQFATFKYTILSHPSSFFYSFSNGLGGDMIGEWAYYLMSPFNFIYLFFPIANFPTAILIVTVLKFGSAGLSMGYLLKKLKLQSGYAIPLFAINYALSGWFVANDLNLLWLDAAILLPFLILQLELLLKQGTWYRYAIVLALTIISNYYIAYMIAIFIILYFLWRISWPQQQTLRWRSIKNFCLGSLIGGGLSAWLILPMYCQLKLGKTQYNTPWSFKFDNDPIKLLLKLIPGSFDFNQMQNGQANLFVSIFIIFTVFLFFTSKTFNWRIKFGALIILFILILATTWAPLTLLFHGMQYPVWYPYRFSFIISFVLIYLGALSWQPTKPVNLKHILSYFILIILITFYALTQLKHISYIDYSSVTLFAGLAILTITQLITRNPNQQLCLLFLVTTVTLISNVTLTLNRFSYISNAEYQRTIHSLYSANQQIKDDRSFHRVAQTFQRTRGDALMLNFYGGSHFSSTLSKNTTTFFANIGQPEGDNYVAYTNGSLLSDALLNMKYLITPNNSSNTKAGSPITRLTGYRPDSKLYQPAKHTQDSEIWQNPFALPLTFAANEKALQTRMLTNNPLQNQNNLLQNLSGGLNPSVTTENFSQAIGYNVNAPNEITDAVLMKKNINQPASLDLKFTPKTDDSYYLTIGAGLPIKDFDLLINNHVITQFNSYRHTVIVNLTTKAQNTPQTITIRFKNTKTLFLNNLTLYRINQKIFDQQIKRLQSNSLIINKRNDRLISGRIHVDKHDSLVMSTIPDAPGWHVYLDGHRVKKLTVANYFIAFKASPGSHELTYKYTPPFFEAGVALSLLSFIFILFSWILRKKLARRLSP